MKKPQYLSQMFGFIFLGMGIVWSIIATTIPMGIMHPSPKSQIQSVSEMTLLFYIIGFGLCLVGILSIFISRRKENLYNELISNNKVVIGKVDEIQYKRSVSFGMAFPYVVYFSYSFNAKDYQSRSQFIWEKPSVSVGDKIDVFINDNGDGAIVV